MLTAEDALRIALKHSERHPGCGLVESATYDLREHKPEPTQVPTS